ncbi:MAG: DoxX family protein [Verrucomicrobiota bacterium]|jgi:hypothetical protein
MQIKTAAVARVLLGLGFLVFGLNGFLHFLPQPKTMPEGAGAFFGALMKTGYMIPMIFATQTLVGALLLLNRFVPLALALIAPVIVNIVAFHIFLAPSGLPLAGVVLVLELYLAWAHRKAFCSMLAMRAAPGTASCAATQDNLAQAQPQISPAHE